MHISKFKVVNYKSFYNAESIELTPGINIITGQNNSGKTALLEALSLRIAPNPHRSTKTLLNSESTVANPNAELHVEFTIEPDEVINMEFTKGEFSIQSLLDYDNTSINETSIIETYFGNKITINAIFSNGTLRSSSFKIDKPVDNSTNFFSVDIINKKIKYLRTTTIRRDSSSEIVGRILPKLYLFKAERLNISQSNFGINKDLSPDASNLAEVIQILSGNTFRFERFNSFVRRIFPQIFNISTKAISSNIVQIVAWNEDPRLEREDLAVPLSQCGTGLGQVLAILYVVLTSDTPRVILIDEPNSFLHPGAARKLIEILKEHKQHQFIISTHSPSTLSASSPKTIHVVKIKDAQSSIESVDVTNTAQQQVYLAEIGAKLSDVFGADSVLWVEGKTEELCFPKIIEKMSGISQMGTVILSVINTGDFQRRRNADLIFSIYEKLTKGKGLMPPAIGFIFDSENLTAGEKEDLQRKSNGSVTFLERRMFENYLINSNAIFKILRATIKIEELNLTLEGIEEWMASNQWNKKYIPSSYSVNKNINDWLKYADGAKFLGDLFEQLTETKVVFDKIKHSVALCDWIIENSFKDLKEIEIMLSKSLKSGVAQ